MRHTKIICTIGPASQSVETLEQLLQAGMNIARLNFSHGTHADHQQLILSIRQASQSTGIPILLLQDLQGPRIRTGNLPPDGASLVNGQQVVITTQEVFDQWTESVPAIPTQYQQLIRAVQPGGMIYIQDGLIGLQVTATSTDRITCTVVAAGTVYSHKGMNAPGANLPAGALTDKDRDDVGFGIEQGVDYIALSFVRDATDMTQLRQLLPFDSQIQLIAKIERAEAVQNIDTIIAASDAIMVARGDLGVEIGVERVPVLQKDIIADCRRQDKPVIVATQMLESMVQNPRPTRAEASDVANAVIDHATMVMLSAETATGLYPVQAVQTMAQIITTTEQSPYDD